jgi:hypothetical protein
LKKILRVKVKRKPRLETGRWKVLEKYLPGKRWIIKFPGILTVLGRVLGSFWKA